MQVSTATIHGERERERETHSEIVFRFIAERISPCSLHRILSAGARWREGSAGEVMELEWKAEENRNERSCGIRGEGAGSAALCCHSSALQQGRLVTRGIVGRPARL